jgi:hypothetical protein
MEHKRMYVANLIDAYCDVWNEPSAAGRADLLAKVWAPGANYVDPSVQANGAHELLEHIAKVRARRPGARVLRTSAVEIHHCVARFAWHVVQADGTALPEGLDIAFISPDYLKIERIIGFFGPLNQAVGSA